MNAGIKVRTICLFVPYMVLLSACDRSGNAAVEITGLLRNSTGMVRLQEVEIDGMKTLDSILPEKDGSFRFRLPSAGSGFYVLGFSSGAGSLLLLLENGEHPEIRVDAGRNPVEYSVTGSPGSSLIRDFYQHSLQNRKKADSLNAILRQNRDRPEFYRLTVSFDSLFLAILEDQRSFGREFIRAHPNSLASLIVLNYRLGIKTVLDPVADRDLYYLLDSTLSSAFPGNKHVDFHHRRVLEFRAEESAVKETGKDEKETR